MMETTSIYQDMAQRTGGSVYIGVVGPVRTGKSTFVKRFMETLSSGASLGVALVVLAGVGSGAPL